MGKIFGKNVWWDLLHYVLVFGSAALAWVPTMDFWASLGFKQDLWLALVTFVTVLPVFIVVDKAIHWVYRKKRLSD